MMKMKLMAVVLLLLAGCTSRPGADKALADTILGDSSLTVVETMAHTLLKQGFNAGSGYSQVWIRDMNTFVETSLKVVNPDDIRGAILVFFALQQPNNEIVDGYVLNNERSKIFMGCKEAKIYPAYLSG